METKKLRTLKDFGERTLDDGKTYYIDELREAAMVWVNQFEKNNLKFYSTAEFDCNQMMAKWLRHFFNLEEKLK